MSVCLVFICTGECRSVRRQTFPVQEFRLALPLNILLFVFLLANILPGAGATGSGKSYQYTNALMGAEADNLKNTVSTMVKEAISSVFPTSLPSRSYSSVASTPIPASFPSRTTPSRSPNPGIIVTVDKPDDFINEMKKKVNPIKLKVQVPKVKKIAEKKILIEATNKEGLSKFSSELKNKFPEATIAECSLRKPEIVIFDTQNNTEEDVRAVLEDLTAEPVCRIASVKAKSGKTRCYATLTKNAYNKLVQASPEKLYLGYSRCRYATHIPVRQCYACFQFGHLAKDCKATELDRKRLRSEADSGHCPNCARDQIAAAERANGGKKLTEKEKETILSKTDHKPFEMRCPAIKTRQEILRQRYDF